MLTFRGSKFHLKSIFGACELQHGQKLYLYFGSTNLRKEGNLVWVSKTLGPIFGVPKTLGLICRGQQINGGMDSLIQS